MAKIVVLLLNPNESSAQSLSIDTAEGLLQMTSLKRFLKDESGATAIEYGLIAALIAVVIITVVTTLGTSIEAQFQLIADAIAP